MYYNDKSNSNLINAKIRNLKTKGGDIMRKFIILMIVIFGTFACQKEKEFSNFEKVEFKDLRAVQHGLLTLVDLPREIQLLSDRGNRPDTLGETKLFFNGNLLSHRNWETTYMNPLHKKTDFNYAYQKDIMIVMVKPDYVFFDRLYIICNGVTKEFPFTVVEIKNAEINLSERVLKITFNNSWARTGPIPDETKNFNY